MSTALVPFTPSGSSPALPKLSRREQSAAIDRIFTPDQQKAVVAICSQWWEARLESIELSRVNELEAKLDYIIATYGIKKPSHAEVTVWKRKQSL